MSKSIQDPLSLVGRLLMSWLFLPAGIGKVLGFSGTVAYIASAGLPLPAAGAVLALLVEIFGGLALILGYQTRIAAIILAIFTIVASFFFHAYWAVPADKQMVVQLLFNKNVAVAGGLLMIAALGAGGWSLDARRSAKK